MATTDDAAAGWELYRNSGFSLNRDAVNQRLTTLGFSPISDRTYEHYHRLQRRGFRRYISINRLDTMRLQDPFADESIRSRYASSAADVAAQVVVHYPTGPLEVLGRADSISELSTEIVVTTRAQVRALQEAPAVLGSPVTVNFLQPPATVYGMLDFISTFDVQQVRIGVVFRQLIPLQSVVGGDSLPATRTRFIVGAGRESAGLDVISQDVFWLLQTIEAARSVVNTLLGSLTPDLIEASPPEVERLTVASPSNALLKLSIHVSLLISDIADKVFVVEQGVANIVRTGLNRPVIEGEAEVLRAQADHIRAQSEGIRLDNRRKGIQTDVLAAAASRLIAQLQEDGRSVTANPDYPMERLTQLFERDLMPGFTELQERSFELEVEEDDTDGDSE